MLPAVAEELNEISQMLPARPVVSCELSVVSSRRRCIGLTGPGPAGPYLSCRLLELIPGWAFSMSSPPGFVAVIGAENAGRAPANARMDGAAHARASPFPANYLPQGTCCSSAAG